jgi:hypothetical protein
MFAGIARFSLSAHHRPVDSHDGRRKNEEKRKDRANRRGEHVYRGVADPAAPGIHMYIPL